MSIAVIYPYPCDQIGLFEKDVARFFSSLEAYDPGADFQLVAVCSHYRRELELECAEHFEPYGVQCEQVLTYTGAGCDIGTHQFAANCLDHEMIVCCSTRVHFWQNGWLARIQEAWSKHGPGLYGAMASMERAPHIRTCFYACSPKDLREFPHVINSRDKTFRFETGDWNFTHWMMSMNRPTMMVTWDQELKLPDWRKPANIFRRGDQSACLVFDRHTEIYKNETPERQAVLRNYADGSQG